MGAEVMRKKGGGKPLPFHLKWFAALFEDTNLKLPPTPDNEEFSYDNQQNI